MKDNFANNNFDLIRLLAALQVVLHHCTRYLKQESGAWAVLEAKINFLFPGVPIFFFISGFLISKSFESNSDLVEYARNRALRIYPALIICTLISILSMYSSGYSSQINVDLGEALGWIGCQITFCQFYNPDFMRGYGTGVLNGSLWTVSVELQFYMLIPILYWAFGRFKKTWNNVILVVLVIAFMLVNWEYQFLFGEYHKSVWYKLWGVSFAPSIYLFITGILFQKNFELMHRLLKGRVIFVMAVYLIATSLMVFAGFSQIGIVNPAPHLLLAALIFSFAYSLPGLADALLKKNDISYGVYIYHIPVINIFIYYGLNTNLQFFAIVLVLAVAIAVLSWAFVERPSLRLKKHPLSPVAR